jgi:hypothetical protein
VFDRLIATLHPPVRPHPIAKLPPVRSAGAGPRQRADTSTRTGESPNRVFLSVVGIVPAEIAGVLVLIVILILILILVS